MSTDANSDPVDAGSAFSDERPATVRVTVGRVGKAHGLRGEVSVHTSTDEAERRFAPGAVLVAGDPVAGPLVVESARWHSGRLLVKFENLVDRTTAEAARGAQLEADVDAFEAPADPDEYFDRQLVGLAAVTPQGESIGTVAEVMHLPGHDILAVRAADGHERLVPFVRQIVPVVDVPGGRLVVAAPDGLFDVNTKLVAPTPDSES